MTNTCIACGAIIPEGLQVCPPCEAGAAPAFKDIIKARDYCESRGWTSYRMTNTYRGYICGEMKGAPQYDPE